MRYWLHAVTTGEFCSDWVEAWRLVDQDPCGPNARAIERVAAGIEHTFLVETDDLGLFREYPRSVMNWIHATWLGESVQDQAWTEIWEEVDVLAGEEPRRGLGELRAGQSLAFSTEIPLDWFVSRLGEDFSFELLGAP